MPIPASIATAAEMFRMNAHILEKSLTPLKADEWLKRPNGTSNHVLWIVGHMAWARGTALSFTGTEWSHPWLSKFARGAKVLEDSEYPSPDEVLAAWREVAALTPQAFEAAPEEKLVADPPPGIPTFDGKTSGVLSFLAFHESYHVGQVAYVSTWLGHTGPVG